MGTVGELSAYEVAALALRVKVATNVLAAFLSEARMREPGAAIRLLTTDGDRQILVTFEFGDVLLLRRGLDFDTIMAMGALSQYCTLIPASSIRSFDAVVDYRRLVPEVEIVTSRDLRWVMAARTVHLYRRMTSLRS